MQTLLEVCTETKANIGTKREHLEKLLWLNTIKSILTARLQHQLDLVFPSSVKAHSETLFFSKQVSMKYVKLLRKYVNFYSFLTGSACIRQNPLSSVLTGKASLSVSEKRAAGLAWMLILAAAKAALRPFSHPSWWLEKPQAMPMWREGPHAKPCCHYSAKHSYDRQHSRAKL